MQTSLGLVTRSFCLHWTSPGASISFLFGSSGLVRAWCRLIWILLTRIIFGSSELVQPCCGLVQVHQLIPLLVPPDLSDLSSRLVRANGLVRILGQTSLGQLSGSYIKGHVSFVLTLEHLTIFHRQPRWFIGDFVAIFSVLIVSWGALAPRPD
jgi:hypothetical protein